MNLDSLTNRGEYLSAHYLAEMLPGTVKSGVAKQWSEDERHDRTTPRTRLRALRRTYNTLKGELIELDPDSPKHAEKLRELHREILAALGFADTAEVEPQSLVVERAGQEHTLPVVHSEPGIVVIESGWAVDADAAADPDEAGRLLDPVTVDNKTLDTASALASYLLLGDDQPPRYVVILSGAVVILADRLTWFEGRYLAVSLDVAFGRNDTTVGGELDVIAALFAAEALRPPPEGGAELLATLRDGSRQHAVGVSTELREGLRLSVELIANEVLARLREAGVQPEQIMDPAELGKELARESLRYLYRILFLLYAEARPELGVLPTNNPEYTDGYSLARLGEIAARKLVSESAGRGFHLYESLDLLFRMVNEGHNPRGGADLAAKTSESEGIRFEPLRSDLFLPEKTRLIGTVPHPDYDDEQTAPPIDTRLRNACLHQVLRWLMLARGKRKGRGGFISYAQLGINQLGAVYEGLMSYTGFIATEELYEVAKKGDPKDGSWMIPASKVEEYPDEVFVHRVDDETGVRSRVRYPKGAFVYRLAGRDRQISASYYTPQSLTEVTVQLALKYRLEEEGREVAARELLDWTICEPALGSGAFLNEAINQVAAEYLRRAQKEREKTLDPEQYALELQRVKAYIALHNCYGVDLNRTAVELAEVSLWLNTMHPGLQAPWFGLHLRRGNSLIGCGRRTYEPAQVADKSWLKTAPTEHKLRDGDIPSGAIHHFLLPADGWGAVAGNKEARELAPEDAKRLAAWRKAMLRTPTAKGRNNHVQRLQALSRRVEYLWKLVLRRLEISEKEIRRDIQVWGADELPSAPPDAVAREKILEDLESTGTPYWRLKTVMDTWCALWFWPLDKAVMLDGTAPEYGSEAVVTRLVEEPVYELAYAEQTELDLGIDRQLTLPTPIKQVSTRTRKQAIAMRRQVPLANLDDWLDFLEAMLGRHDIAPDSLHAEFETLADLEPFEDTLPGLMAMDEDWRLADRFPWLTIAAQIAVDQAFFHWELHFANAFANGGFDLQVGNPPWVRPDWQEDLVLAEREPWFQLAEKPSLDAWQTRKSLILSDGSAIGYFLRELTLNVAVSTLLSHGGTYALLRGTRPDFYRAFMCRVWAHVSARGCAGLIHPDSHFWGAKEAELRSAAYHRLRIHGGFVNASNWAFADAARKIEFGVHVYASPNEINFVHLSQLRAAEVLTKSLEHGGDGPPPRQRINGSWDRRPHAARVITVDLDTLAVWQALRGDFSESPETASLLQPVSQEEERAIRTLALYRDRLSSVSPWISAGYNETNAKKSGFINWRSADQESWDGVVLQGPHFGIATPIAKKPRVPCRNNHDWDAVNLSSIDDGYVPSSNYVLSESESRSHAAQDTWGDRRYTEYFRVAWRRMAAVNNERSLFAALIPPGPTHVHTVHSLALRGDLETALNSAFWASIPLDYLLRVAGRVDIQVAEAHAMPLAMPGHPLASSALLRTMRMNSLTKNYAPLWSVLYTPNWAVETWAVKWPGAAALGVAGSDWSTYSALRTEYERRAALVEVDALVSVWLGLGIEELLAILRARYPALTEREEAMWFDAAGRRIAADPYAFGLGQTREHYGLLMTHLEDPTNCAPPEGYVAPFYKADREREYREAHAVFSKRLQDAIDSGWSPS